MDEAKARIVIPNADDYRTGIPVLSVIDPSIGRIYEPKYDSRIMGGRILTELPKFRRDVR